MAEVSEQFGSKVEVGVFDMSRLPVRWDKLETEMVQQTMSAIEGSLDEQVQQLTMATEKSPAVVDKGDGGAEEEASGAATYKRSAFAHRVPPNRTLSQ
jgi:hypothetical protein